MKVIPASGPDVFAHLLRLTGDSTLRSVIVFRHRLDSDSLARSADGILRSDWIFSSRIEDDGRGWMRWVHEGGLNGRRCISEHEDAYADPDPYCFIPVDDGTVPPLRIDLIHGADNDSLVISSPHSVLDGKGMKELTKSILNGCIGLFPDDSSERFRSRSEIPIWDALGDETVRIIGEDDEWPYCSWPSMYGECSREEATIAFRRIPMSSINGLRRSFGMGITVHDMLIAALYCSLRCSTGASCSSVSSTVDNRRYFPRDSEIPVFANLSSNYSVSLPQGLDSFNDVVVHVSKEHRRLKEGWIGLPNLLSLSKAKDKDEALQGIRDMKGEGAPGSSQYFLSNLGVMDIDDDVVRMLDIKDAYCTYPGVDPPTVGLTVSTFQGVMNINTGLYHGADRERTDRFLDAMVAFLIGEKDRW